MASRRGCIVWGNSTQSNAVASGTHPQPPHCHTPCKPAPPSSIHATFSIWNAAVPPLNFNILLLSAFDFVQKCTTWFDLTLRYPLHHWWLFFMHLLPPFSHTTGRDSISIINDASGCNVPIPKNMRKEPSCTCSIVSRLLMQPQISTPYSIVESTRAFISFLTMGPQHHQLLPCNYSAQALSGLLPAAAFSSTISFNSRCSSTTQPNLYTVQVAIYPTNLNK